MAEWTWGDCFDLDGKPITLEEWSEIWADDDRRIVQKEDIETEEVHISTVWLGTAHWGPGAEEGVDAPLIYESMVFDLEMGGDIFFQRYASYMGAEYGHRDLVADAYAGRFRDALERNRRIES